jgi:hypothetical protein
LLRRVQEGNLPGLLRRVQFFSEKTYNVSPLCHKRLYHKNLLVKDNNKSTHTEYNTQLKENTG